MDPQKALHTIKRRVKKRLESETPFYSAPPKVISRLVDATLTELNLSFDRHNAAFIRRREQQSSRKLCFKTLSLSEFFQRLHRARYWFKAW